MSSPKPIEPRLIRHVGVDQATGAYIYEGDIDGDSHLDRVFVDEEALLDLKGTPDTLPADSRIEPKRNFWVQFGFQNSKIFNNTEPTWFRKANGKVVKIGDTFVTHNSTKFPAQVQGCTLYLQDRSHPHDGPIPSMLLVGVYVMHGRTAEGRYARVPLENVLAPLK